MNIIDVKNLTKTYGDFTAVDNVSFSVKEGAIFGLLGPNGAGKTTTIECMIGIKKPDRGEMKIMDMDVLKVGKKLYNYIGVQLQETSYQDKIKVCELCGLFTAMYEKPLDYLPLLEKFGLSSKLKSYVNSLSGGEKQKIAIILALISNPKVIFLDELTTGLDPKARIEMWELVKDLKEEGRTVFLTTHYMQEAEYLCDTIGIIDSGKIVVIDNVEGVISHAGLENEVTFLSDDATAQQIQQLLGKSATVGCVDGLVTVQSPKDDIIMDVAILLREHQLPYKQIDIKRPCLEDAYLKLTGKCWEA